MNTTRNSTSTSSTGDVTSHPGVPPVLLTLNGLAGLLGVSERTATNLLNEPWAPRPIVLGPRMVRHSAEEWRAAVANMPRQTERSQPESLLRARIERMKATGASA